MNARSRLQRSNRSASSEEVLSSPLDAVVGEQPGFLFRRLHSRATVFFHKYTEQAEITPRQFGVLMVLHQGGKMTQWAVGEAMSVDKSTLGEMIQRMVNRGLLGRDVGKEDRRTTELWLTDAGRAAFLSLQPKAEAAQQALLDPLPPEYRPLFVKCLKLLTQADENEGY